jgi:hypothetical protein
MGCPEASGHVNDQVMLAAVLNDLGEITLAMNDHERARQHHENALAIAAQHSADEQARALQGITNCQTRAGQASQAAGTPRRAPEAASPADHRQTDHA